MSKVLIDGYSIDPTKLEIKKENPYTMYIEFLVSHESYHDVTVLLYKNDFLVKVPDKEIEFQATISQYSTSLTNLYKKDAIGEFYLELMEKQ